MLDIKEVISRILGAKNTAEVKAALVDSQGHTLAPAIPEPVPPPTPPEGAVPDNAPIMGVAKIAGVSINRLRKEANQAAIDVINRVGSDFTKLTAEDTLTLRKYSGIGGTDTVSDTGGHIHEYYTPSEIAEGVWDGLKAMGFTGGNGLEPSSGTGVFQATKPSGVLMTASEIDKTSSAVNQLLHPEDMVLNQPFEKLAAEVEDGTFDSCVGNVPFGTARGATAVLDPDPVSKEFANIADYFVARVIDKVKAGGLIGLVVPTRIVSGTDTKKLRRLISRKAEFLGAHRLPSGVFSDSGTDVVTDIIFLRKHSEELASKLPTLKDADLKAANVLWDTFISGKWFDVAEGKRFVHGESERLAFQNKLVVNNANALTNAALKEKLGHKFESRIDWDSLNAAEPLPITYAEGDEKLINGRWMRLIAGQWEPVKRESEDGKLNGELYGATSLEQLASLLSSPTGALSLSYDQLMAVYTDFPYLTKGALADFIKLASNLDAKYRDQVIRGSIIGMRIQAFQFANELSETDLAEARSLILTESERFGIPSRNNKLAVLTGKNANYWNAFSASLDKNGEFSQLLRGEVVKGEVLAYDSENATQTVAHLFSVRDLVPVPLEEFLEAYTGKATSIEELAEMDGIAITPDGMLAPLDRATSGNIVDGKERILAAMANETSPAILNNYQRQLDEIERKRVRTPVDAIDMTMSAKWLPRSYVMEFMKENGYSEMAYSKIEEDELGDQFENFEYTGNDGVFSGYQTRNGKKRSSPAEQFERQVENYLNGLPVRSADAASASAYKSRIKDMEGEFGIWLRQHDDIDLLVNRYNDKFNGFIPIEHSGAPLNLTNISGEIVNFDYQCSEIRRLSETGSGICGFGTGLGKSATALGLVSYNTELGRARRTGLVVPKSVIENWYHESKTFFGHQNMANVLFIGVEPVLNKDGTPEQETVLDEKGEVKINKHTGQPMFRDKLKSLSGKEVKLRLNAIPHSNYTLVVMTKEQYASIPMRPESVGEYVDKMVGAGMLGGKYVAMAKKHREALKNEKFKEKYADTGTEKAQDVPYFEDMGFDNIIVDEGHNYRNSYRAGRETSKLAYLPTQASAQVSVDMAIKGQLIKNKFGGRGVVMLSATPTVNSPTDIFNMLSHVMTVDQWGELGITDVDDFVRVFGETEEVPVQKLSGEVEMKTALVGFRNLSGLRGIFHKHVNLKTAKDVSDTVAVPDIEDHEQECPMTDEQSDIYEELRVRAEELSKLSEADKDAIKATGGEVDSVFRIIREMDRVTTDIDLYNKEMTFVLPIAHADALAKLVNDLPDSLSVTVTDEDKTDEEAEAVTLKLAHNAKIRTEGESVILSVQQDYENEVIKRLAKFNIPSNQVSHPITPKYARLIENLKVGLEDGKQIIFTEEKTQHNKLLRIILNHLGLNDGDIAIINADTVSGKDIDNEQASLEKIALAYNEGRHKILIANKKAEVGVNLHHGTTDIHHLTLPWTPASIKQRNGRGARVGASQKKVRAHYYVGKGSFDEFRLASLKRKADWMNELFTSDADRMANADASNNEEMSLLLAKDANEREARIADNQKKAVEKVKAAQKTRATIDLNNFIKASHDLKVDSTKIKADLLATESSITKLEAEAKKLSERAERYANNAKTETTMNSWYLNEAKDARKELSGTMEELTKLKAKKLTQSRLNQRLSNAESQIKRLRPTIEKSIKDGLLDIDPKVIDQGDQFLVVDGRTFAVGKKYDCPLYAKNMDVKKRVYVIESIDFNFKTVVARLLYTSSQYDQEKVGKTESLSISMLRQETDISQSELDLNNMLTKTLNIIGIADKLTKEQFFKSIEEQKLTLSYKGTNNYGSDRYVLIHSGDSFESLYISSYGAAPKEEGAKFVYPDPNDQALKKKLALWILADRKARTDKYNMPVGFYEAILGTQWAINIESYGSSATDAEISVWGAKTLKLWLETEQGKSEFDQKAKGGGYISRYTRHEFYTAAIPAKFDNISAFEKAFIDMDSSFEKQASAIYEQHKADSVNALKASYKLAISASADSMNARAKWLFDELAIPHTNISDVIEKLKSEGSFSFELGGDNWQGAAIAVLEDLTGVTANFDELMYGQFTTKVTELCRNVKSRLDELAARFAEPKTEEETSLEDDTKVEAFRQQLETEAKKEHSAISSKESIDGVIIKLNESEINEPATKYQSRGRWRTNPARHFGVGEVIAIHDPEGKSGKLYQNKEALKALVSGVFFSTDLTSDFDGSWWFVPASVSIEQVKKAIGV